MTDTGVLVPLLYSDLRCVSQWWWDRVTLFVILPLKEFFCLVLSLFVYKIVSSDQNKFSVWKTRMSRRVTLYPWYWDVAYVLQQSAESPTSIKRYDSSAVSSLPVTRTAEGDCAMSTNDFVIWGKMSKDFLRETDSFYISFSRFLN